MVFNELFIAGICLKKEIPRNSYLEDIPVFQNFTPLEFDRPITFFVGENGSGKSTLLEALAIGYGFNPEGGTKNFSFSTKDTHSNLSEFITIEKGIRKAQDGFFLRAESFYNVATQTEKYAASGLSGAIDNSFLAEYGGDLHAQSHGESFLSLVQNRFSPNGLYILDEPEAALSPQRQLTLMVEIHNLIEQGSQFIISTHSPVLLAYPNAAIFSLDRGKIEKINYEDADCYRVMEMFINNREQILKNLFPDN